VHPASHRAAIAVVVESIATDLFRARVDGIIGVVAVGAGVVHVVVAVSVLIKVAESVTVLIDRVVPDLCLSRADLRVIVVAVVAIVGVASRTFAVGDAWRLRVPVPISVPIGVPGGGVGGILFVDLIVAVVVFSVAYFCYIGADPWRGVIAVGVVDDVAFWLCAAPESALWISTAIVVLIWMVDTCIDGIRVIGHAIAVLIDVIAELRRTRVNVGIVIVAVVVGCVSIEVSIGCVFTEQIAAPHACADADQEQSRQRRHLTNKDSRLSPFDTPWPVR